MANIVIKEIYDSDNILALAEKVNFNFDQLILAGGGPAGPSGGTGPQGPVGPNGIRGSQWFGATGSTTINQPTDGVLRDNDFLLNADGTVDYYDNSMWLPTGIDLTGPEGPKGDPGDGAISILEGYSVDPVDTTTMWAPLNLAGAIDRAPDTDVDDEKKNNSTFINGGVDYVTIGHGNNSLVLGRYPNIFPTFTGSTDPKFYPPGNNKVMNNYPSEEKDVPMLFIAQNDYQNPASAPDELDPFTNGISIGLNKTHDGTTYGASYPYKDQRFDYQNFANISMVNRFFDFQINGPKKVQISSSNGNSFTLGTLTTEGIRSSISDYATKLDSNVYTEFNLADSIVTEIQRGPGITLAGTINRADFNFNESTRNFSSGNDLRGDVSANLFSSRDWNQPSNSNEIVLTNNTNLTENTSTQPDQNGKVELSNYLDINQLKQDRQDLPLRLGQTVINISDGSNPDIRLNVAYEGQGYDQFMLHYSNVDNNDTSTDKSIQSGNGSTLDALLTDNEELLGYKSSNYIQENSRSLARVAISPGVFRQQKVNGVFDDVNDPNAENRKNILFDESHKLLPTGSMDIFGTIRIREMEETDNGNKDGFIAQNVKDGIVKWSSPNESNLVPAYSIQMFPDMVGNKFSFMGIYDEPLGASNYGSLLGLFPRKGGTNGRTVTLVNRFPGKGCDEMEGFYICNGALVGDTRDMVVRGPFSKMKGLNMITSSGPITGAREINGQPVNGEDETIFEWTVNEDFVGAEGQRANDIPFNFDLNEPSFITAGVDNHPKWVAQYLNTYRNSTDEDKNNWNWGYSVPAPQEWGDSGFRLVLPNYFGRVPKMVFPSPDSNEFAITGQNIKRDESSDVTVGWRYFASTGVKNGSFYLRDCFDYFGTPYLDSRSLPNHGHNVSVTTSVGNGNVPGPPGQGNERASAERNNGGDTALIVSMGTDKNSIVSGGVYTDPPNYWWNDAFFKNGSEGNAIGNMTYDRLSNWYNGGGDAGQGFIEPPYKGTFFAINLKGVRNPLRNNTIVPEFDFLSNVPSCGLASNERNVDDLLWQSIPDPTWNSIYNLAQITTSGLTYNRRNLTAGVKRHRRNDVGSHPYSYAAKDLTYNATRELYQNSSVNGETVYAPNEIRYFNQYSRWSALNTG